MNKIILILLVVLSIIGFCGYKSTASASSAVNLDPNLDSNFVNYLVKDQSKMYPYLLDLRKNDYNKFLYYMGIVGAASGNDKDAVDYLSEALKTSNNNPYIYEYRAIAYIQAHDYQKAIEDANIAVKMLPDDRNPLILRMKAYRLSKNYEAAIQDIELIQKLSASKRDLMTTKSLKDAQMGLHIKIMDEKRAKLHEKN